jgi:ligand-binding sensor domain-containing protein
MRLPFFLFFLLVCSAQTIAQPHPAWRQYALEDGLPDNTVYGMCEDSIGRLYFATNSGICRFDGYKFQRFPGPDEVNAVSVFWPQADSLGRVWFRSISGRLYFIQNDSICAWQWNVVIDNFKGKHGNSVEFAFFDKNSIVLTLLGLFVS